MARAKVTKVDDDDERGTAGPTTEADETAAVAKNTSEAKAQAKVRFTNSKHLHRVVSRLDVDQEATDALTLKGASKGLPASAGKPVGHAVRGNKKTGRYLVVTTDAGTKWARQL